MNLVLENPFRILGLPASATSREIARRVADLSVRAELGSVPSFPLDLSVLPAPDRSLASVRAAAARIGDVEGRWLHGLFWFRAADQIDEMALESLVAGRLAQASRLWDQRIARGGEGLASWLVNRAVLGLVQCAASGDAGEASLRDALGSLGRALSEQPEAIGADPSAARWPERARRLSVSLVDCVSGRAGDAFGPERLGLVDAFAPFPAGIRDDVRARLIEFAFTRIDAAIAASHDLHRSGPVEAAALDDALAGFERLRHLVGADDAQLQGLADRLSTAWLEWTVPGGEAAEAIDANGRILAIVETLGPGASVGEQVREARAIHEAAVQRVAAMRAAAEAEASSLVAAGPIEQPQPVESVAARAPVVEPAIEVAPEAEPAAEAISTGDFEQVVSAEPDVEVGAVAFSAHAVAVDPVVEAEPVTDLGESFDAALPVAGTEPVEFTVPIGAIEPAPVDVPALAEESLAVVETPAAAEPTVAAESIAVAEAVTEAEPVVEIVSIGDAEQVASAEPGVEAEVVAVEPVVEAAPLPHPIESFDAPASVAGIESVEFSDPVAAIELASIDAPVVADESSIVAESIGDVATGEYSEPVAAVGQGARTELFFEIASVAGEQPGDADSSVIDLGPFGAVAAVVEAGPAESPEPDPVVESAADAAPVVATGLVFEIEPFAAEPSADADASVIDLGPFDPVVPAAPPVESFARITAVELVVVAEPLARTEQPWEVAVAVAFEPPVEGEPVIATGLVFEIEPVAEEPVAEIAKIDAIAEIAEIAQVEQIVDADPVAAVEPAVDVTPTEATESIGSIEPIEPLAQDSGIVIDDTDHVPAFLRAPAADPESALATAEGVALPIANGDPAEVEAPAVAAVALESAAASTPAEPAEASFAVLAEPIAADATFTADAASYAEVAAARSAAAAAEAEAALAAAGPVAPPVPDRTVLIDAALNSLAERMERPLRSIEDAAALVDGSRTDLAKLKAMLGRDDPQYLAACESLASLALDRLVPIVDAERERTESERDEVAARAVLDRAGVAARRIAMLDLGAEARERVARFLGALRDLVDADEDAAVPAGRASRLGTLPRIAVAAGMAAASAAAVVAWFVH